MDRFVKTPAELIIIAENEDLIQASKADETTRNVFTAVEIQHMCELVQRGRIQIDVVATWNIENPNRTVSAAALSKWMCYFHTHKTYFTPATRGPKLLLLPAEEARLLAMCARVCQLGWALDANRFRSMTRGLVKKMRGDRSVEPVPGIATFSAQVPIVQPPPPIAPLTVAKKRPGRPKNQPAADPRQPRLDNFLKKRDREPK